MSDINIEDNLTIANKSYYIYDIMFLVWIGCYSNDPPKMAIKWNITAYN